MHVYCPFLFLLANKRKRNKRAFQNYSRNPDNGRIASWIMLKTSFTANGMIPGDFWSPCKIKMIAISYSLTTYWHLHHHHWPHLLYTQPKSTYMHCMSFTTASDTICKHRACSKEHINSISTRRKFWLWNSINDGCLTSDFK